MSWRTTGLLLGALAIAVAFAGPLAAAEVELPATKATWSWAGPAQHPFAVAYPGVQYVGVNGTAGTAQTFVKIDLAALPGGKPPTTLTLTVPVAADAGAGDPGAAAALQACPATSDWSADPQGRPVEQGPSWDCEVAAVAGTLTEAGWTFDITAIAASWIDETLLNDGLALVPAVAEGSWSVSLHAGTATAAAVSTRPLAAPEPPDDTTAADDFAPLDQPEQVDAAGAPAVADSPAVAPFEPADEPGAGPELALGEMEQAPLPQAAPPADQAAPVEPVPVQAVLPPAPRTVPAAAWIALLALAVALARVAPELRATSLTDATDLLEA